MMTLKEQLARTTLNILTVELELNNFVIDYNDEYIRQSMETIKCLECENGYARLVTTTTIDKVIIENGTELALEDYLVMEDFEMRAFEILYEAGKLKATYKTTDEDNDGILEIRKYDVNTHNYFEVMTDDKIDTNFYNEDGTVYVQKEGETLHTARAIIDDDDDIINSSDFYIDDEIIDSSEFKIGGEDSKIKYTTDNKSENNDKGLTLDDYENKEVIVLKLDKSGKLAVVKKGFAKLYSIMAILLVTIFTIILINFPLNINIKMPKMPAFPDLHNMFTYENTNNVEVGDVNAVGGNFVISN